MALALNAPNVGPLMARGIVTAILRPREGAGPAARAFAAEVDDAASKFWAAKGGW